MSYPLSVLLRACLLKALLIIKSERALCEQIALHVGFPWFVSLGWVHKVFDHSTLSFNRKRLLGSGALYTRLGQVVRLAEKRSLVSSDRHVVNGILIKVLARRKSFEPKDGDDENGNIKGKKLSNQIHEIKTVPDSELMQKGNGQESMPCHLVHILIDSSHRLAKAVRSAGPAAWAAIPKFSPRLRLVGEQLKPGQIHVNDRGYDDSRFVSDLNKMGIHPHPRTNISQSQLDG